MNEESNDLANKDVSSPWWDEPLKKAALVAIRFGLIAAIAAFAIWVLGWMERDTCRKADGIWLKAAKNCVCTKSQRGVYADNPTEEQIAYRTECELKPTESDWIE